MRDFSYAECRPSDEILSPSPKPRVRRSLSKKCDRCSGRGWILRAGSDWAQPCERCGSRSLFRTMQLARLLGVNRRDVYRVDTLRAGSRVGVRVLEAIVRVFPEALR